MAPRSIWNGTITFGLVKVPIKLYSATESRTIRFRQVHIKDGAPLEHRRICTAEDVEVEYSEIVKGYEVNEDEYVVLTPDEVKAAAGDRGKVVEIEEFVDAAEIDPIYFEKTYFAGFRDDPEPYALLERALERSGKAGIGRFTFHNREYLVAVRSRLGVIAVHTLRFEDEIVRGGDLNISKPKKPLSKKEVSMAGSLIEGLRDPFRPENHHDEHREQVRELIDARARGEKPKKPRKKDRENVPDLTSALEASIEAQQGGS
ncbi:MAG TPA: Ku protein [Solirubrobacterales bacterium]|nr:Ku protein [Solirubrobacterales bacterium]